MKLKKPLSRRDFGKIAAGLGLTSISGFSEAFAKEEATQKLRENIHIKYIDGVMQWKIDRKQFKRFESINTAFHYTPRKIGTSWAKIMIKNRVKNLKTGKHHPDIPAESKADARSVASLENSSRHFKTIGPMVEGMGYFTDKPKKVPKFLQTKPDETNPEKLTVQAKLASRFFGSDIVGVAPLNHDWVYENYHKTKHRPNPVQAKKIVFKDVEDMEETETELIIPSSVNNVIVTAFEQNREMLQSAPSLMAGTASEAGYSRMFTHDVMLAEFIRGLGYIAIPTSNIFAMNVPLAVEAGLGEAGRLGTLVTPEYGPNIRLSKVLTNMPLVHDKPIEFGVQEFCDTCKKCARDCPSKSITEGPKSWDARNICSQGGVFKWQNDYQKCLKYWMETGTTCSICVAVCPFTKGAMWVHELVGFSIDKMRWLDPVFLGLDDAFGYAERRKEKDIWNMSIGSYGLDHKHFKNAVQKGKFPL